MRRETIPTVLLLFYLVAWGCIFSSKPDGLSAWLSFFTGLYPAPSRLGWPSFRFHEEPAVVGWAIFMALVYVFLNVWSYRSHRAFPAWSAFVLVILSGVAGFVRSLYGIEG